MLNSISNVFSLPECEKLKKILKNPEDDFQEIISLLERKVEESNKQFNELEEKYHSLINGLTNVGIGIDIVTKDYRVLFQNQVLKERFGDCRDKKCYKEYMGLEEPCKFCPMEKALKYNSVEHTELTGIYGNDYELISAPFPNPDGSTDKVVEVVTDITEHKKSEKKLLREKKFTETAINAQRDTFFIFEPSTGKAIRWNRAFKDISGYNDDEISRMKAPDSYYDENDSKRAALATEKIKEDGEAIIEMNLITKDGRTIPFEYLGSSIKDEDGNPKYIIAIGRDITEKKKIEQELRDSENKYRHLFNEFPISISLFDIKGNLIESNKTIIKKLSEYANLDFVGKNYMDIIPHFQNVDQLLRLFKEGLKAIRKGISLGPVELFLISKSGKKVWLHWQSSRIKINNETFFQVIIQDITERKEAEEKLKESEEKFRTIAEQSLIGIGIVQDNLIKYVNEKFANIFGYTVEEMLDWSPEEFMKTVHPEHKDFILDQARRKQEGLDDYLKHHQFKGIKKCGEVIWIENFTKSIMYEGRPGDLVTQIDITERMSAQQELIKLNQLKTELLRRTSHELKTPLVSIKGFSDLLLEVHRDKLDAMVISTLNEIKQGCLRLESLIGDILKTAELESGTIQLNKTKEDLSFLVRVSINEIKGFSKLRNHTIILEVQDNLRTQFEKEQIHQVISNLLNNAVKYTPPSGIIEIKSDIRDDLIIISIKDNGIGFTEEEKTRIFKQFGKIERYGQGMDIIPEGSGFGLFISKKIIELHGGEIWLESDGRNKGATFYFSLPLI